jgi:hypothetical protein
MRSKRPRKRGWKSKKRALIEGCRAPAAVAALPADVGQVGAVARPPTPALHVGVGHESQFGFTMPAP